MISREDVVAAAEVGITDAVIAIRGGVQPRPSTTTSSTTTNAVVRSANWPLFLFVLYIILFIATVSYLDLGRFVRSSSAFQHYFSYYYSSSPNSSSLSSAASSSTEETLGLPLPATSSSPKICPAAGETFRVKRLDHNPIITDAMKNLEGERGENINGPSLLYVPSWVQQPLGRYYLYFGHHAGSDIRMAYSNDLVKGPWRVLKDGCITVDDTPGPMGHIASPEVLVDHSNQQIILYFHGDRRNRENEIGGGRMWSQYPQITLVATSSDGLAFQILSTPPLAPPYLRVFQWGGHFYGIVKDLENGGLLLRSRDGQTPFEVGPSIINRMRHAAVLLCEDVVYIFFSRLWDSPERLLYTKLLLSSSSRSSTNNNNTLHFSEEEEKQKQDREWRYWKEDDEAIELLTPEMEWEGGLLPVEAGTPGGVFSEVHALRDPCVFFDPRSASLYLLYTVKGEKGIAIAQLEVSSP
eukprot:TRINITY_DN7312_c0_g1_i1.p1 TRINITY_DN7312_c0_g1~~TRINITY_DN7312_c0_g1_i1.p1  ORF type:complete len:467 (-),score=93.28 TRINITY_DN7312_c0_g1_i1:434-1834(-)